MAILYVWHALDRDCTQFEMCCLRICQPHFSFSSLTGKLKQKKYVQMVFACSFRTLFRSFLLISLAPFCFPSFYANALVPPTIHGHKKSWIYFVWLGLSLFCAFLSPLKITYSYLFKPNNDIALVHSVCTVDERALSIIILLGNQ